MSLNGLDDAKVKEAHDAAVAEPGGWFLLKYTSRDGVELLDRGTGGVTEVRNAVEQYEEKSPLFGFLRYRRRNVIIKYLPEECSRLVQARVTVHFISVCDRFSPYDTDFSISEAKELKDTKLSAACSLHAASGSTSSSTSSLRRRRLVEITEEEEEDLRDRKRQSIVKEEEQTRLPGAETDPPASSSDPPVTLNAELASSPEASKFADESDPPRFTGAPRSSSPAKSFDDAGRRMSSQSSRPDIYSTSAYPYGKPRVKLAPRPSADLSGRPRTSAGAATFRPVSTIPAGLKLSKTPKKGKVRDQDDDAPESPIKEEPETPFSAVSNPSLGLKAPKLGPARPHTSSGAHTDGFSVPSFRSNMPSMPPPPNKQNVMTPEKQRLLKAMKLREKKKTMTLQLPQDPLAAESSSGPSTPGLAEQSTEPKTPASVKEMEDVLAPTDAGPSNRLSISKADSGVDIGTDQTSITDSHPTSPFGTSEIGDSTQASSLSESTDETILVEKESSLRSEDDDDAKSSVAVPPSSATDEDQPADEDNRLVEVSVHDRQSEEPVVENLDADEQEATEEGEAPIATQGAKDRKAAGLAEVSPPAQVLPISKFSVAPSSPAEQRTQSEEALHGSGISPVEPNGGEAPRTPQIRIPVSKFSTHESRLPTSTTSQAIPSIVTHVSDTNDKAGAKAEGSSPTCKKEAEIGDVSETASVETRRSKRIAALDPIRTDLNLPKKEKRHSEARHSEASLSDDDGLMDELQSATVQQAQPITVSKSPINQFVSGDSGTKRMGAALEGGLSPPRVVRTVSNPIRGPLLTPDPSMSSARAVSSGAAYLHKITQQQSSSDLRPKTGKIGSSISQRIKALEKLSANTASTGDTVLKERPASSFFSVRKREPSRSPSVVERTNSLTRVTTTPSPPESGESSPETGKTSLRDRTGSMVSRLSMFEGGKVPRGRPESIQVTARIVRDTAQRFPKAPELRADPTDYEPLDLKQSPLLVDLKKRAHSPSPRRPPNTAPALSVPEQEEKKSLLQRRFSTKGRRSQSHDRHDNDEKEVDKDTEPALRSRRRSSLTVVKDFIKDRRESLLGARSPSTDNLNLDISASLASLASPTIPTPSKSPSRPPSVHQNGIFPRRLSISSRRSSIEQSSPVVPAIGLVSAGQSPSRATEASGDSDLEGRSVHGLGDKAGSMSGGSNPGSATTSPNPGKGNASRATRFIRRLSNTLVSTRKTITPSISPTVAEEDADEVEAAGMGISQSRGSTATGAPSYLQPSIVAYMGDVNVQFPDNLLWKRRTICLDNQGFLILSAIQGVTATMPSTVPSKDRHHQAGAIKRYHMSDFRPPYPPEMELQELPNSVVLDFVDGSGLQIACEDRAGQTNVLHVLQEAHRSHTSFGK
ncbi:hypothetical protein B0H67DRAFT_491452 [Lasiosphaeris hirsuta]|uniref:ADF-H domain-containing protein n=1 Tax=Lasiosphaeris hirsuta TaxID=260670 RepID=A0AA40DS27_9PEZI|nr:hypothetical protein B0H67DRAFT_491452 [Lasiosphaeris hirsuta]